MPRILTPLRRSKKAPRPRGVIREKQVDGKRVELWFQDEARIGQKNKITRRWARRGTRPRAPHDQRTKWAYIFGAICPAEGKGAGLVMPWCDTEAMQAHLVEISTMVGRVPDARTIWLFRELLTKAKAIDALFARFDGHLRERGYLAMGGQMIDASIIEAPRQRNTDAEKDALKAGRIPDEWTAKPSKLRQKDRDGRWTLKRGRRKRKPDGTLMMEIATPVYGYKSHVGVDRRHRFIRTWSVTDAARYDGRELPGLLDRSNTVVPHGVV